MNPQGFLDNIKKFFKSKTIFANLILANILLFALVLILEVVFTVFVFENGFYIDGSGQTHLKLVWSYLSSTSDLEAFIGRPWSVITYMFVHEGFGHIFGNMLTFYFFGRYLEQFLGSRKLLSTYLIGGIAGWILYVVGYNFIPMFKAMEHGPMWGASAAVLATVVAAATYRPNMKINLILIQVEFKYIAAIMVVGDFLSLKSGVNAGGHLGHLGGAIYGFLMIKQLQKGRDINSWLERIIFSITNRGSKKNKMKVVYKKSKAGTQSDEVYNYSKAQAQQKIDRILEKISVAGYDSLTKAEKAFLNKYSRQ